MARISGIDIPREKRVIASLKYIHGVGAKRANDICIDLKIDPDTRVSNLTNDEIAKIRKYIEANFRVEGDLRRDVSQNIRRKTEIGTYQGIRHRSGLPVRGQRTHTNARTRKGPRFAVAGTKKVLK
ncbi:MAG: 30S ribosomal protein S13 [Actinomycetota bacterium]|nr:30S ribosomal protein S13 [Actinomycetota bacterium]|tara:strand:+ start:3003 stop:3380 length:378 start_codon:yes stop_codon:yes gene_type:complete